MNDKRLQLYLDDHYALLVGELELVRRCRSNNRTSPLGDFLKHLEGELRLQQDVLHDILRRVGGKESTLKNSAAWIAEKLGRFKLNDSLLSYSELSRVYELETLAAAAQERIALWDNLEAVADGDPRLAGQPFADLRRLTSDQLAELDDRRRYAAVEALTGTRCGVTDSTRGGAA